MRRIRALLIFLFSLCGSLPLCAQVQDAPIGFSFELDEPLPIDPSITVGQLENGLRYYIKINRKPENRAELRLAVNVGSVLEDEDQQGLAHFCEHMAFNGTKHFAKQELVDFLESIGMRFGPEINAYTGFDETVYMLEVPTDSVEIVEKAFLVLKDWAHQVSYEAEEIDKERGVIIEEWRLGRGAQARMRDKQLPIIFKGSRYANRLPIGKKAVVDTCHYETLCRFYRDWYRPDLMAVIAVGDFDKDWIEGLIRQYFSSIPAIQKVRERKIYPVPDHDEILFAIAIDPEATRTSISVYFKNEVMPERTVGDYRRLLLENIYDGMMNQRLYELTKTSDPPFLYGASGKGRFVRSKGVYYLAAGVKENGIIRGLETLLIEAERVKRFGFTRDELDRMKKRMLREMETAYNEKDKTRSSVYASEYIRNFFTDEPIPGVAYEFELHKQLIPSIELEEVNQLAGKWITDVNRVILVNAPQKPDVKVPTEGELLAVFESVGRKDIEPYAEDVSEEMLVKKVPEPAGIVEEKTIEALGVTEWKLTNGVRVILKPTDFQNDEILFSAFSPGGNSLAPDEDYIAAITATAVIREGGLSDFNQIELGKKLAGKVVRVTPRISTLAEGISGSSSSKDIETLFRLIYLYFTSPRKDSTAFQSYRTRLKGVIENRSASPEAAYQDTLSVTLAQYHHRARPWSEALLDEMDLEKSFNFYQDRFGDAGDFTFIFVGNFELETLKFYVQAYLGGLPSLHRNEIWRDTGMNYPTGVINKVVRRGIEAKGRVSIIFTGSYQWSRQNNYDLESMVSAVRIKLREILREDLGGTYGVGIGASKSRFPKEEYSISISFGCAPERVDELTDTVFTQIDSIKNFGLDSTYVVKVRESQMRQYETNLKENGFWLGALYASYFYNQDPLNILDYEKFVENLSVESVQEAAQRYFTTDNYVRVVLVPEENEQRDDVR